MTGRVGLVLILACVVRVLELSFTDEFQRYYCAPSKPMVLVRSLVDMIW